MIKGGAGAIKTIVSATAMLVLAVSVLPAQAERNPGAKKIAEKIPIVRPQILEALSLALSIRPAIDEFYAARGQFPADNTAAGLPEPAHLIGNYVTGISVKEGAIHIALGNRIDKSAAGKILSLRPAVVSASPTSPIAWVCGYAEPVQGMVAQGDNLTSVAGVYLPAECRAWNKSPR